VRCWRPHAAVVDGLPASTLRRRARHVISRIWHGWTTRDNADEYERLLKEEIFVGIQGRRIRGFKGIELLRRARGAEVEFVTIMKFDSLDAVRDFAGNDYELAVVPEAARAVLARFDERSQHYEIRASRGGEG
jgi:antibiotic biosynthesis monooxygenase (ABM) superfamily enzyme